MHRNACSASRLVARTSAPRRTVPFLSPSYARLASTQVPKVCEASSGRKCDITVDANNPALLSLQLKDPSLFKQNVCYVNGAFVPAKSGATFAVADPTTGEHIGDAPEFDAADTEAAIAAAENAFKTYRLTTGRERSKLLRRWYDLMIANADDIATLITWENGKTIADAKGEVTYAANFFEWFSEEAPRVYGDTIQPTLAANRVVTRKEPVGVCSLITP